MMFDIQVSHINKVCSQLSDFSLDYIFANCFQMVISWVSIRFNVGWIIINIKIVDNIYWIQPIIKTNKKLEILFLLLEEKYESCNIISKCKLPKLVEINKLNGSQWHWEIMNLDIQIRLTCKVIFTFRTDFVWVMTYSQDSWYSKVYKSWIPQQFWISHCQHVQVDSYDPLFRPELSLNIFCTSRRHEVCYTAVARSQSTREALQSSMCSRHQVTQTGV